LLENGNGQMIATTPTAMLQMEARKKRKTWCEYTGKGNSFYKAKK
jgi:hypothetical protein